MYYVDNWRNIPDYGMSRQQALEELERLKEKEAAAEKLYQGYVGGLTAIGYECRDSAPYSNEVFNRIRMLNIALEYGPFLPIKNVKKTQEELVAEYNRKAKEKFKKCAYGEDVLIGL